MLGYLILIVDLWCSSAQHLVKLVDDATLDSFAILHTHYAAYHSFCCYILVRLTKYSPLSKSGDEPERDIWMFMGVGKYTFLSLNPYIPLQPGLLHVAWFYFYSSTKLFEESALEFSCAKQLKINYLELHNRE